MNEQLTLLEMPPKFSVMESKGINTIYWNGHYALASYRVDDDLSKRMVVVILLQTKIASYAEVASLLGYSESNLSVLIKSYREKGVMGLLKKKTGPKNTKVTPEIRRLIKQIDGLTLNEMVDVIQEQHGVSLSDWTVSAVKREKLHRDQLELFSDDLLDSILHNEPENDASESKEVDTKDITETVEGIQEIVEPVEEVFTEESGDTTKETSNASNHMPATIAANTQPIPYQPVKDGIQQEQQVPTSEGTTVIESRYAGGFLLLPFLQEINPAGLFQQAQETCGKVTEWGTKAAYGMSHFINTLLFLLWFQFSSIEDFKFVQPREFGVLLGGKSAPSVKTLRRYFPTVLDGDVTEEWMLQLVRRYIQLDVIQLGTLYFDGHKIPYYGHVDLPKGYIHSKRFPAKLIEQVFANDRSGRPIFLRVHDTSLSFKDTVLSMIEDAQTLWKEQGIRAPLVVAFDRELYDTELFTQLDEMGVLFITWRKWDKPVAEEQLTEKIMNPLSTGTIDNSVRYQAWRRDIVVQDYEVEAISFLDTEKAIKDPKRSPSTLVTNASKFTKSAYPDFEPLSTGEIIDTLCGRWRQENYFRYSKHEEHLDYNPEYRTKERTESLTVANPRMKELKQEIKKHLKDIDKLNDKIASRLTKRKKKDKPLGNVLEQKSMRKLTEQKEEIEQQIKTRKKELSSLSEKVPKAMDDPSSMELELEGKRFLDVLRIAMHNAEQMLLDVFKRCYSDPRDTRKVLRAIANQGGTVKEQQEQIIVELNPLHIQAHRTATERLVNELNNKDALTQNEKKIIFTIKK